MSFRRRVRIGESKTKSQRSQGDDPDRQTAGKIDFENQCLRNRDAGKGKEPDTQ